MTVCRGAAAQNGIGRFQEKSECTLALENENESRRKILNYCGGPQLSFQRSTDGFRLCVSCWLLASAMSPVTPCAGRYLTAEISIYPFSMHFIANYVFVLNKWASFVWIWGFAGTEKIKFMFFCRKERKIYSMKVLLHCQWAHIQKKCQRFRLNVKICLLAGRALVIRRSMLMLWRPKSVRRQ